ncbi:marine proteobacterial sortase target protein [Aliiglaciecola lipolytica]|uniref:marine proteobacterial sortase target protein n=1 Tax=Aliiglaciecola lipolytica TaxID=477689 RepID=UPI001C09E9AC|nr:marine proteobacterial sortase target protein [Aliiglaciecola lipolytica]
MIKRLRFVIVLSLLFILGAVQYATPFFKDESTDEPSTSQSRFKIDVSYESVDGANSSVYVDDYQQVEQGSLFLQKQGEQGYLLSPLLDTRVDMNITGLIARAKVTQTFTNISDEWVNGIYVFPLPENAAVDHLEMRIGERRIVGQIHPKQKAKAIYEQAKREGKKASLLVQQRLNLFKNSVANIGPGESIKVTIEYQQAVAYENNTFSLRFPTTVTPRYLPKLNLDAGTQAVADSGWGMTPPVYKENPPSNNQAQEPELKHKVAINIALNTGFALQNIESKFHPIHQLEKKAGVYEISLQQNMIANQDFVLSWQPEANQSPKAAHFVQRTEEGIYGMVMLMPPDGDTETLNLPREVIFVIDTSGSMSGDSMPQAKQALIYAIQQLPESDTFNLVEFDSTARKMWATPKVANTNSKSAAVEYVANLSADGGTEMLSALQLALGQQSPSAAFKETESRIRQVIFITDGSVGNEASLFEYIQDNLQQSRLFTVGIGSAPNSFFMTEAARMGKGTFTYIGSTDSVQQQMQNLFTKLTHPLLTDLMMSFSQNVEVYPRNLPDLYKGEPLMVSYRGAEAVDNLIVTGSLKNQHWQTALSLQNGGSETGLNVLWARRKIAQLGRDKMLGQDYDEMNKQIEQVAMAHHLVSEMTSLVAVDVTPTAQNTSKDAQLKSHLPKGLKRTLGTLPQTATVAQLQWMLALLLMGVGLCMVIFTRHR